MQYTLVCSLLTYLLPKLWLFKININNNGKVTVLTRIKVSDGNLKTR